MEYRILGRTGLSVSVMGLGGGGHSRLGLARNLGEDNAIQIVRHALDSGINFIDTAEAYGTEEVVGKGLKTAGISRESVVLSTKVSTHRRDTEGRRTANELREAAEGCLRRLQTDFIDILHLHGVSMADYDYCVSEFIPVIWELQDAGKIRYIGITEAFIPDPGHAMLQRALQNDFWDVMMVGFNLLNQSARTRVFPVTCEKNIGVLDMFAVRRALSVPDALRFLIAELAEKGQVTLSDFDADAPLDFLLAEADTIPDAAYRFCRDEPGGHVVLSGTGNLAHLADNHRSLTGSPLSETLRERLSHLFARVDSISGN